MAQEHKMYIAGEWVPAASGEIFEDYNPYTGEVYARIAKGKHDHLVYYPTVLTGVQPSMKIFTNQTFGPIAPIIVVEDDQEALDVANNSKYGLSSGIITNNFIKALEIARRLETGMVHINDQTVNDEPQVPFGGVKGSGYGRLGGKAALEEFTELRWINVQQTKRTFP